MSPPAASRILHVDDNPDSQMAVRAALESLPDEIVWVDSGKKALRRLLDEDFGLILLDVNMPEMDGFEVADQIKRIERLRQIPILFLSAVRQEEAEVFKGYSIGAVDYLFTPVSPNLLRAKASSFLTLHRLNGAVRRQADELGAANARLRAEIAERERTESALREAQGRLEVQNGELDSARRRAEAADRCKSEFLANMSHEIRTPLTAILGFSEFLLGGKPGELSSKQSEYLGDILTNGRHLLQLINDVLDLSKVEAGRMEFSPESFAPAAAITEVCHVARALALKKQIDVQPIVAPELDCVVVDRQKFKQVLYNLLSNAVKFTPPGGRVEIVARVESPERFAVAVRDTGAGIAPADQARLFREFVQIGEHAGRGDGTGLGLAITKKMVEAQRGSISVESAVGKGSTFSFVLPRRAG